MNLIQRIRFPESTDVLPLYLKLSGPADLALRGKRSAVRMGRGSTLSLNTYFNSFYEKIWAARTNVRSFVYELELCGRFTVRIYRDRFHLESELVCEIQADRIQTPGRIEIPLPNPQDPSSDPARIYLEITALEDGEFFGGALVTEQAPSREVTLALISVTYQNEPFIRRIIESWAGDEALLQKKTSFFVIDNGSTLDPAAYSDARLRIIPNRNLGGSGGFNRGMLEAADCGGFTHYLLMDDDIVLDPESVLRLITFYEYAKEDCAVAGAMLDLNERTLLYESGATIGKIRNGRGDKLFYVRCLNTCQRLDRPHYLNAIFGEETPIDCAGFWFFGFPSSWIEQSGLLMPFFIHGDDIEFCLRQQIVMDRAIVALPSLGIWHHTWRATQYRQPSHMVYYDMRNFVILYFLYANIPALDLLAGLTRAFFSRLFTFNYEQAAMVLLSMRHIMDGPRFLSETDPAELHQKLRKDYAGLNDARKTSSRITSRTLNDLFKHLKRPLWKSMAQVATLNGHLLPDFFLNKSPVLFIEGNWRIVFGSKSAVLAQDATDLRELRMRRKTCIVLFVEWARLSWKFVISAGRLRKAWRQARAPMTSPDFVRKFTGMKPGGGSANRRSDPVAAAGPKSF